MTRDKNINIRLRFGTMNVIYPKSVLETKSSHKNKHTNVCFSYHLNEYSHTTAAWKGDKILVDGFCNTNLTGANSETLLKMSTIFLF